MCWSHGIRARVVGFWMGRGLRTDVTRGGGMAGWQRWDTPLRINWYKVLDDDDDDGILMSI